MLAVPHLHFIHLPPIALVFVCIFRGGKPSGRGRGVSFIVVVVLVVVAVVVVTVAVVPAAIVQV